VSRPRESLALTGRAFRVHFGADADPGQGVFTGRIEHMRSGDAAHFTSVQELLAFVEFWLTHQRFDATDRDRLTRHSRG
jgi:hypothetical protein